MEVGTLRSAAGGEPPTPPTPEPRPRRIGRRGIVAILVVVAVIVAAGTAFLTLGGAQPVAAHATEGASAVVQGSGGKSAVVKFAKNPKPGSTILAFVQTAEAITSVVDNGSTPTTFTRDAFTLAGRGAYVYRANDVTLPKSGPYKITVTVGAPSTIQANAIEFTNLVAGPPVDSSSRSGTGKAVSTSPVKSTGDAVFFGGFSDDSTRAQQAITFSSAPAGFAQGWSTGNGASYWPAGTAHAIVTGPSRKAVSWKLGNKSGWGAVLAVYRAGAPDENATPPDTRITASPADRSKSRSARFEFGGSDTVTAAAKLTYECKLDSGPFGSCTSPQVYQGLVDGKHTFEVRAQNGAGKADPSPAGQTWVVASGKTAELLPDLGMGPINDFSLDTTTMPGHKLLRFNGTLANVGAGPFEVEGSRPWVNEPNMSTKQRVYQTTSDYRPVPSHAVMFYAGDGHQHWHIKDLEGAKLTDLQGNVVADTYIKTGFCASDNAVYDSSVPGTPKVKKYSGCGKNEPALTSIVVGISVGWGDWYPANVRYQWLDITKVPPGTYRVWAIADPNNDFLEANESNNETWTDIKIGKTVDIVDYGPHV